MIYAKIEFVSTALSFPTPIRSPPISSPFPSPVSPFYPPLIFHLSPSLAPLHSPFFPSPSLSSLSSLLLRVLRNFGTSPLPSYELNHMISVL